MNWDVVLTTLGGSALLLAAVAWLIRSIIGQYLNKDLSRFKAELQAHSDKEIETFKAALQLENEKSSFQFNTLHVRRAEILAKLYAMLDDLYGSTQLLSSELQLRENREDFDRKREAKRRDPWELVPGIHFLTDEEKRKIEHVGTSALELYGYYREHKVYLPSEVCIEIDRFLTLTSYTASNYQNIAIKDENGQLMVNAKVKEMWIEANRSIPGILSAIENRFRDLLGG